MGKRKQTRSREYVSFLHSFFFGTVVLEEGRVWCVKARAGKMIVHKLPNLSFLPVQISQYFIMHEHS